jgi:isoleucyl-tRNA synthetase
LLDAKLTAQVKAARALAEAGRAARKASRIRIRQPLAHALVGLPAGTEVPPALLADVADELNVKHLAALESSATVIDVTVKPNFRELGKRFGKRTQAVATAVTAAEPGTLVERLRGEGTATVMVDGEPVPLAPDDVLVTEVPRTGWVVESTRGVTIALDTQLTPELTAEGIARDVVRSIQQARREAGFDVSDRIIASVGGGDAVLAAMRAHEDFAKRETLADTLTLSSGLADGIVAVVGEGDEVRIAVARV